MTTSSAVPDAAVDAMVRVVRARFGVSRSACYEGLVAALPHLVAEKDAEVEALKHDLALVMDAASEQATLATDLLAKLAERDARIKALEEALQAALSDAIAWQESVFEVSKAGDTKDAALEKVREYKRMLRETMLSGYVCGFCRAEFPSDKQLVDHANSIHGAGYTKKSARAALEQTNEHS